MNPTSDNQLGLTSMTGFLLLRAGQILLARAEASMESRGIRVRYCFILAAMADAPDVSQHDLSQAIGLDAGTLGQLVDEMQEKGHVERKRHPQDKRRYVLNLTDAGRKELATLMVHMREIEAEFLGCLSTSEQRSLHSMLERSLAGSWPEVFECTDQEPLHRNRDEQEKETAPAFGSRL